jgi:predicted secreted protein
MALFTAFAIYFIIWWLCLFITLAFHGPSQLEAGEIVQGTDPSAPVEHKMWQKLLINSIVAGGIFCLFWVSVNYFDLGFDDIPKFGPAVSH